MATWNDVHRITAALPEVTERATYDGRPAWRVKDRMFAWDRPLRAGDLAALGGDAPDGPVLAARVPD
ncbi:MmcQ/YjbR family DNA-binding protein, partial [Actinosynnema sp. NPDC023658]